jgi:transcriptional regulator with XRE-family HTH domain
MNALHKARIDAGLTLRELSEKSGVATETLSRLENDQRKPQVRTLNKIANALGIPVSVLADGLMVTDMRPLMRPSIEEATTQGKVVVPVAYRDNEVDHKLHQRGLRFSGKKIDSEERYGGEERLTLYECPRGYRVHILEASGEAYLRPTRQDPDTGEIKYSWYSAENLVEDYPELANAVGLYPIEDIE